MPVATPNESSGDPRWGPIQEKLKLWREVEVEQNRGFKKVVKKMGPPQGYAYWHRPYRWGKPLPNPDGGSTMERIG